MSIFSKKQDDEVVSEPVVVEPTAPEAPVEAPKETEAVEGDIAFPDVAKALGNTNFARDYQVESQDEANNPTVQGKDHSDKTLQRRKNESQAEYNERVAPGDQPVQPMGKFDYLGRKVY